MFVFAAEKTAGKAEQRPSESQTATLTKGILQRHRLAPKSPLSHAPHQAARDHWFQDKSLTIVHYAVRGGEEAWFKNTRTQNGIFE